MIKRLALTAFALALPFAAHAADPRDDKGKLWWVIVDISPEGADRNTMNAYRAARRCGATDARIEESSKFEGARPGFQMVVLGPYTQKSGQGSTLEVVKECVPTATGRWMRAHIED